MSDFDIAPATPADLPGILAIYNDAVLNSVATFDTEPRTVEQQTRWFEEHGPLHPVFVARREGRVVGWASLSPYHTRPAYDRTVEDSVYVAADSRGRGIGTALLARLIEAARAVGHHTVIALIAEHSPPSVALHRRAGFSQVGVMRQVGRKFDRWLDVTVMQLLLQTSSR